MNIVNATTVFDANLATRAQMARLIETIGRPDFAGTVMEVIGPFPTGRPFCSADPECEVRCQGDRSREPVA